MQLRAKKLCGLLYALRSSDRSTRHPCSGTEVAWWRWVDDTQMAGEADSQKRQTSLESHIGSVHMAFLTIHKVGHKNREKKQTCTAMFSNLLSVALPTCFHRVFFFLTSSEVRGPSIKHQSNGASLARRRRA